MLYYRNKSTPAGKFTSVVRVIFLFLIFASIAILYYLSANILNTLGFGNLVFVDGITWLTFIDETMKDGLEGFINIRAAWLIFLIYYPLLIFYNPIFLIIANSVFLSMSASFCRIRVAYVTFIFALPFFIVNSLLPNKEILSLLLSIIFFFAISKKRLGVAFLISLIIVFVRDGMGYAFVLVAILLHFRLLNRIAIIFILSFLIIIDFYLIEIQSHFELFVLQRTIGFFEMENLEWQPYYIRIFANSTNLISRVPIFTSDGWASITGISLFLAGFSVFIATVLSLITCVRQSKTPNSQIVSSYAFLFILFITSLSPLIQPRYMIPVSLGYLFGCRVIDKTKKYIIILSLAALFPLRIAYGYLNSLPEATNFWPAGFFL